MLWMVAAVAWAQDAADVEVQVDWAADGDIAALKQWQKAIDKLQRQWVRTNERFGQVAAPLDLPNEPPPQPVPDAQIVVEGAALVVAMKGTTDTRGRMKFSVPPGVYQITVSHVDSYPTTLAGIVVELGPTRTIEVDLDSRSVDTVGRQVAPVEWVVSAR